MKPSATKHVPYPAECCTVSSVEWRVFPNCLDPSSAAIDAPQLCWKERKAKQSETETKWALTMNTTKTFVEQNAHQQNHVSEKKKENISTWPMKLKFCQQNLIVHFWKLSANWLQTVSAYVCFLFTHTTMNTSQRLFTWLQRSELTVSSVQSKPLGCTDSRGTQPPSTAIFGSERRKIPPNSSCRPARYEVTPANW